MKHLATIQVEFLKAARNWNKMSLQDQKEYLKRHPKSKRKLTGKSESIKSKHNVNKLTPAGINKRIRAELGHADQYKDVNNDMSSEVRDGENVKVITKLVGVPKQKLEKVVKKLFGDTDKVKVTDKSEIVIKSDEPMQLLQEKREQLQKTPQVFKELSDQFNKDGYETILSFDGPDNKPFMNVKNPKGYSIDFKQNDKDSFDGIVQGYKSDIHLGDVGRTYKDLKEVSKAINKSWMKENDPEGDRW